MTILSIDTKDDIRRLHDIWVARLAFEYRCERSDVLAAIQPQPSPASQAPATRTSPPVSVAVQADGEQGVLPSSPSVEPIPEAPKPLPDDEIMRRPAEAKTSEPVDGGAVSAVKGNARLENAVGVEPPPSAPFKPKRVTQRQRVKDCHEANPTWSAAEIAAELDMSKANVWSIASQIGIKFEGKKTATTDALRKAVEAVERAGPPTPRAEPKLPPAARPAGKSLKQRVAETHRAHPDWSSEQIAEHLGAKLGSVSHALHDARTAAGTAEVEVIPPANPQTPVAPPPTGEGRTLTERVRAMHHQHPTWTASLIAKEIGAKPTSVSTILGQVRGKPAPSPEQPQFSGRRQMVEHYGEIAKRLGKAS